VCYLGDLSLDEMRLRQLDEIPGPRDCGKPLVRKVLLLLPYLKLQNGRDSVLRRMNGKDASDVHIPRDWTLGFSEI